MTVVYASREITQVAVFIVDAQTVQLYVVRDEPDGIALNTTYYIAYRAISSIPPSAISPTMLQSGSLCTTCLARCKFTSR